MIYTIRTTSGREDIVIDLLMSKVQSDGLDIKSIFHPAEIKGYVFIEGSLSNIHKAMVSLMHSRGLIDKPIRLAEIQHFLESTKTKIKVDQEDIVEIIGGPFKGEKGRVIRINKIKDEITAELLEASIPIPVTIATEFVKIIKKGKSVAPVEKLESAKEDEKSVFDTEEVEKVGEEKIVPSEKSAEEKPIEKPPEEAGEKKEEKKEKKAKSFLDELEEG